MSQGRRSARARPWSCSPRVHGRRSIDPYLKSGGLTRDDLKIDVVDPAALWGTYIAKRADGLMSTVELGVPDRRGAASVEVPARPPTPTSPSRATVWSPGRHHRTRGPRAAELIEIQQRAWEQMRENPEDGVKAMIAERPTPLRSDGAAQPDQLTLDYFETPATKGKPIGWQATDDWEAR